MAEVRRDVTKAVQKAIEDSTNATDGDVAAFLRSLLEQGFYVQQIDDAHRGPWGRRCLSA